MNESVKDRHEHLARKLWKRWLRAARCAEDVSVTEALRRYRLKTRGEVYRAVRDLRAGREGWEHMLGRARNTTRHRMRQEVEALVLRLALAMPEAGRSEIADAVRRAGYRVSVAAVGRMLKEARRERTGSVRAAERAAVFCRDLREGVRDRSERKARALWRRWYRAARYAQETSVIDATLRYRFRDHQEVRKALRDVLAGRKGLVYMLMRARKAARLRLQHEVEGVVLRIAYSMPAAGRDRIAEAVRRAGYRVSPTTVWRTLRGQRTARRRRASTRVPNIPADAPSGTVACGDLRREPDGRWFFGAAWLGNDDDPHAMVGELEDRGGVVASRLAAGLGKACDELDKWGDAYASSPGRETLRRFERWKAGSQW